MPTAIGGLEFVMATEMILENTMESDVENTTNVDTEAEKYLTFFVDQQLYTIPSSQVIEIISIQPVTYMPSVPEFVKGVINIRGKVIPLIELQFRLKGVHPEYDSQTCIIVVEIGDVSVGFIVDRVDDVTDISKQQINPPPKLKNKTDKSHEFLSGIAKLPNKIAMVLDSQKVLHDNNIPITEATN